MMNDKHGVRPFFRTSSFVILSVFVIRASGFRLASVIGLAPIRPDLKGRLRELLCIHGLIKCRMEKALQFTETWDGFSFRILHSALRI